jgi:hypothetical protein
MKQESSKAIVNEIRQESKMNTGAFVLDQDSDPENEGGHRINQSGEYNIVFQDQEPKSESIQDDAKSESKKEDAKSESKKEDAKSETIKEDANSEYSIEDFCQDN